MYIQSLSIHSSGAQACPKRRPRHHQSQWEAEQSPGRWTVTLPGLSWTSGLNAKARGRARISGPGPPGLGRTRVDSSQRDGAEPPALDEALPGGQGCPFPPLHGPRCAQPRGASVPASTAAVGPGSQWACCLCVSRGRTTEGLAASAWLWEKPAATLSGLPSSVGRAQRVEVRSQPGAPSWLPVWRAPQGANS